MAEEQNEKGCDVKVLAGFLHAEGTLGSRQVIALVVGSLGSLFHLWYFGYDMP